MIQLIVAILALLVIAGTDLADRRAATEKESALKMKVETLEKECGQ
jgi:hypothetical protein